MANNLTGFFVDWDGNTRRFESPGDGYTCQINEESPLKSVEVLCSDGCVIHEATFFPTIESVQAAGVEINLV